MSSEKIEAFWVNATAFDVARVMAGERVEARFRDSETQPWGDCYTLTGWVNELRHQWRSAEAGGRWNFCQVYREPSWHANKPDPGPGFRLLEKLPDEGLKPGDEYFDRPTGRWHLSGHAKTQQQQLTETWYRRRIEQLLSGHRWLNNGDRLESGDMYYEKGVLLEVGHEYWGNKVMLADAFMRKIEQPKPEPVEPKFAVGQTVKVVGPKEKPAKDWGKEMDRHVGLAGVIRSIPILEGEGTFYNLEGIGIWCFREDYLEAVEPEPKHYVLRVGDSFETPSGNRTVVMPQGSTQRFLNVKAGDTIKTIHGQTITITAKGFEVTQ
jgi:hypothetical protein